MGLAATGLQAADLTQLSITDWDGDSIAGGFAFASGTSGTYYYTHFFNDSSTVTSSYASYSPSATGGIATDGSDIDSGVFTAGFSFSNYIFQPNSLVATGVGTATTPGAGGIDGSAVTGDSSLSMSEFVWSGAFGSQMFPLSPDNGFSTNTLTQGGSCSAAVGSNQACYVLRWEHFIQPQGGFSGDTVWQIEGIATFDNNIDVRAVPLPAAFWLFASSIAGLIGLSARRRNNRNKNISIKLPGNFVT